MIYRGLQNSFQTDALFKCVLETKKHGHFDTNQKEDGIPINGTQKFKTIP